jgi:hypothetical protein
MRDARYAAYEARRKADGDPVKAAAPKQARSRSVPAVETAEETTAEQTQALCGHRSIGQKSCTRPAGHEEENHRYS